MSRDPDTTLSYCEDVEEVADPFAPEPQLVLVMRAHLPRESSVRFRIFDHRRVEIGRAHPQLEEPTARPEDGYLHIQIPDRWCSSRHVTVARDGGGYVVSDAGSKNGTILNGEKLGKTTLLSDGDMIELGRSFLQFVYGPRAESVPGPTKELSTFTCDFARDVESLAQVARTSLPVMLLGETGTGKEVAARAAHQLSGRKGSFIAVNCGAIPATLIESELFGTKRGAFSGAEDRPGYIRASNGGTLFLDEIGELPLACQAALLRVLQQREVVPVGGSAPEPVDFRLITATHRDLDRKVASEEFRADLMARISGLSLTLPALVDRRTDIGLLVPTLLERVAPGRELAMTVRAARAMLSYHWPLNVRELEKALELAAALARDGTIDVDHLPPPVRGAQTERPAARRPSKAAPELSSEDEARRAELVALLEEHNGNLAAVARDMGKARMQIHRWLKRYEIDPEHYR